MTSLTLLFALGGAAIAVVALPLIAGRVPPNRWYGFRTPRTLADPRVWYPANAYAGKLLLLLGLGVAGAALLLPRLWPGLGADGYAWGMTAVLLGGLALVAGLSLRRARAL